MDREREYEINQMFRMIYEKYQAPLRTIAKRCGVAYDDIDDVVQETFAAYYQAYIKNEDEKVVSEKAMLVKILKRKCVDLYRKNYHYVRTGLETEEGKVPTDILMGCIGKDVSDLVIDKERYREIRRVIDEMRPDWRDVIYCCCILGYSSAEASAMLGISGTACRSRLMRARIYLRKTLGAEYVPQFAE